MDNKIVILIVLSSLLCVMYMCLTTSQKIVENFEGEELGRELEKAIDKTESDENAMQNTLEKNKNDLDNLICSETQTYFNIDSTYVNTKDNIITDAGKVYVKPKTIKGIYDHGMQSCVSPDETYKKNLHCQTLMMSNCVDGFGLISNSVGENELLGGEEACRFKYCSAFCADIKECWKYDSNNDEIQKIRYNTGCTDEKYNQTKPDDCFEDPKDANCPERKFYNYMSNDLTNRIYDNNYTVNKQKVGDITMKCVYQTDVVEKQFASYDEAAQYCSLPLTTTCHYLSNNIYDRVEHRLEKASCSYNSNQGCLSDLDDSHCDFTKPYFTLSNSEYVGTQQIDSFEMVDVPTELIDINSRQKKCDVSARYIYDNDLLDTVTCEEQTRQCYNLQNDVVQTMYGRKDPVYDKCVYDNCFSFEASSNANEQRRVENIEIERNNEMARNIIGQVNAIQDIIDEERNVSEDNE